MAANYVIVDPFVGMGPVTATHSVAVCDLGVKVRAVDRQTGSSAVGAAEFVYCRGSNVASTGQFVQIVNHSAVILASGSSGVRWQVGVAPSLLSATNVYGWVQVQGHADYVKANASDYEVTDVGVGAFVCATAGALQTAAGIGSRVRGVYPYASCASGTANSRAHKYFLDGACAIEGVTASN